jgi:hypothetical protein
MMSKEDELLHLRHQHDADIQVIKWLEDKVKLLSQENAVLKKQWPPTETSVYHDLSDLGFIPVDSPETGEKFEEESEFVIPLVDEGRRAGRRRRKKEGESEWKK